MRLCYRHPDTAATRGCDACRRPICDACAGFGPHLESICAPCATASARRSRLIAAGASAAAIAVVGGLIAFAATRPPAIIYGEHKAKIEMALSRVANTPCDGQSTLELVELLNKERDYARVVSVVEAFDAACKPVPRIWWASYTARMQLQDYKGAENDAGRLIENAPDDGDFWWWRGKAKRDGGDVAGAEADFKKTIERTPRALYSVIDLVDLLEKNGRACEGVPALAKLVASQPDEAKKRGLDTRLHRMIRETPCADVTAAIPKKGDVATVCSTLPKDLSFGDGVTSGFAFSLKNTWTARTSPVAQGDAKLCAADVEEVNSTSSVLSGTGMHLYSGRLACTGLGSVTGQTLHAVPLKAQEELVKELVNGAIKTWCGI
jgi:tetratricopeptide (TPR) repeat protein